LRNRKSSKLAITLQIAFNSPSIAWFPSGCSTSTTDQNITSAALLASEQAECLSDGHASADYRKHLVKTEIIGALTSLTDA